MQSMKGATMLLGSMNRQMNLPALQRIAMEFERENEVMDERQEMMDDAIDEATGMEGEEEEGEDIVKEVLDEIGVDLGSAVCFPFRPSGVYYLLTFVKSAGRDTGGHTSTRNSQQDAGGTGYGCWGWWWRRRQCKR